MAKVDAHQNGPNDYADIAELTAKDFARGTIEVNGKSVKRGRPAPNGAKKQVTLRLDPDLLETVRNTGAGWQARVNQTLREAFMSGSNATATQLRGSASKVSRPARG